jgi:hypothetical protein
MRLAGDGVHGARMRALIVLLSRAGLRINEALTLTEHDLEPGTGSGLVRHGKGGRRREVGMDLWGWEHVRPWLELRIGMPVGPLLCAVEGAHAWPEVGCRRRSRTAAARRGEGRGAPPLRAAPAPPRARDRARPRGRSPQRHPAPVRSYQSRGHVAFAGDPQRRDHRHRPRPQGANDPRQFRTAPLDRATIGVAVGRTGTGRVGSCRAMHTSSRPAPRRWRAR